MIRVLRALAFPACALLIIGWIAFGQYTLGQDYNPWGVFPTVYYRYFLAHGIFPTWFPAWSGGFPLSGIPAYHVFHLPAWLLSHLPGYTTGGALLLTAAYHVSLFAWLHWLLSESFRKFLKIDFGYAFVLAIPFVYNQRALDAVRYGSYFEATAFYYGMVFYSYSYLRERRPLQLLGTAFFAHCFFTSGYPPLEIYGALGFFVTFLVILAARMGSVVTRNFFLSVSGIVGAICVALLLSAPQWMGGLEFAKTNGARVHQATLERSDAFHMTLHDFFSTLFRPWGADVHLAFSGSTALTLMMLGIFLYLARPRKAMSALLVLATVLFLVLYSFGTETPLFGWIYNSFPVFSWIRTPGRVMSVFPPLLAVAIFESRPQEHWNEVKTSLRAACVLVGSLLGIVALIEGLWPQLARQWDSPAYPTKSMDAYWILSGRFYWIYLGLTVCAAVWTILSRPRRDALWALIVAVVFQSYVIFHFGMFTTDMLGTWSFASLDRSNHLPLYATAFWDSNTDDGSLATTDYSVFYKSAGKNRSCFLPTDKPDEDQTSNPKLLLPFYLTGSVSCVKTDEEVIESLRATDCTKIGIAPALLLSDNCPHWQSRKDVPPLDGLNQGNRITALTTNGLTLATKTASESVLVTPYSWANGAWRGWIDGQPVSIFKVNEGFVGMNVPTGSHEISVFYFSKGFQTGLWVAFLTSVLILLGLGLRAILDWRSLSAAMWAGLFALGFSLVSLYAWEIHSYPENSWRPMLLENNYSELLKKQLTIWRSLGL